MGSSLPPTGTPSRERAILVTTLAAFALAYLGLALAWRADAAKAAPRVAAARVDGKWTAVKDYAAYGTYRFGLANCALLAVLAATAPWWHRRRDEATPPPPGSIAPLPRGGRWFWPVLGGLVVLGTALRLPLARGGFWHDEGLQATRIHGSFQPDKPSPDGRPLFREAPWTDTFFHFRKPTNHTAVGVPSRLCLEAWRAMAGAPRTGFSEFAMRLPSLLAAAGSILLLGLAGRRWGRPDLGLLAALLLSLHPWHVRWGVDLRAYSLGVFGTCLALWSLGGALRDGGWRAWCVFGLAQFLLLWASLLHCFLVAAFFVVAAAWIVLRRSGRPAGPQLSRLFAVNAVAATLFLQVMGPNLLQFVQASRLRAPSQEDFTKLDAPTLTDTASNLLLGLPGAGNAMPGDRTITTFESLFRGIPGAGFCLLAVHGAILVSGLLVLRRQGPAAWLAGAVLAAAAAHLAATKALNLYFYSRFLTYLLPVVALAAAAAWLALAARARDRRLAWLGAPVLLLAAGWPQLVNLLCYEHEPFRSVAAAFADERARAPQDRQPVTACYGLAGDLLQELYDPTSRYLHDRAQLEALMHDATANDRALVVAYGLQAFNRARVPDGFALLDDRRLFTPIRRFEANDPMHTFFVLRFPVADDRR